MSKFIYILLTNTGTIFSNMIKKFTDDPYNHVSLSLDPSLDECYSFGRKVPYNAFEGGFVKEDVINGTYSWFPNTTCEIYELEITNSQHRKLKRYLKQFKLNESKYKYHMLGVMGVALNIPIEDDDKYFCSHFVDSLLKNCGIDLTKKDSLLVKPNDFRHSDELKLIYNGYLYDFSEIKTKLMSDPRIYHNFPFREYMKEKIKYDFNLIEEKSELSFRNDFLRTKKVYLDRQLKKITDN